MCGDKKIYPYHQYKIHEIERFVYESGKILKCT